MWLSRSITFWVLFVCLCESTTSKNVSHMQHSSNAVKATKPIPIEEHIMEMGYPVEAHNITTEDGYILTYHRIPWGRTRTLVASRPPVLVQHGFLAGSPCWVTVNTSLAFVLADQGYDVWLGNARGNLYSRKHTCWDPDKYKKEFFDFSWHEMGYYDLPASIDYILNVTSRTQLSYIGHSMGSTMFFVLGSERPEYMDKINAGVMLGPAGYVHNMRSTLLNLMHDVQDLLNWGRLLLGIYELLPYNRFWYWIDHHVCANKYTQFICRDLIFYIFGFDEEELSKTLLPEYYDYMPAGTSFQALLHYSQIVNSKFKKYDYGFIKNYEKYGSLTPPSYKLENVNAPTYFYLAPNDWIVSPDDVILTAKEMPNLQGLTLVQDTEFNHVDFMWAVDAKVLVYDDIIVTLHKHNQF